MKPILYLYKRDFEAEKHPKRSRMRAFLNQNPVHSEYNHDYKYYGRVRTAVGNIDECFPEKKNAEIYAKIHGYEIQ